MKYLKTLQERLLEAEEMADLQGTETGQIQMEDIPGESDGSVITDVHWYSVNEGLGDFKLEFDNGGEKVTGVFKDTGNRRMKDSAMGASFVLIKGTSSDGKNYVAEALMSKNGEGDYQIESFEVYEFQD